jgi:RimJ/RimL family protein N-acetyltransferase
MIVLETARLRLRHLTADDAAFILELLNEPAWHRFIGDRGVRTLDAARDYIATGPAAMQERWGFSLGAVVLKETGTAIGICGLIRRDTLPDVDLGFALLARWWGHGYAHEIAAGVLHHGRDVLRIPRFVAVTAPDNTRSALLLEKLGFRFERMIRFDPAKAESRLFVWRETGEAVGEKK